MSTFTIEFMGICCFYKLQNGSIRVILPDATNHPKFPHIPHLEAQLGGVLDAGGLNKARVRGNLAYNRKGTVYEAFRLQGHRLDMPSSDAALILQTEIDKDVPHLLNVCPDFGSSKIGDHASDNPPGGTTVAAQFDIAVGDISALDHCSDYVHFVPVKKDPPSDPGQDRRLVTCSRLTLNVANVRYVNLTTFGGTSTAISLHPSMSRIRIGNMTESGILGEDEDDFAHFSIYYQMADGSCTALPVKGTAPQGAGDTGDLETGLGAGCSNTQYP